MELRYMLMSDFRKKKREKWPENTFRNIEFGKK